MRKYIADFLISLAELINPNHPTECSDVVGIPDWNEEFQFWHKKHNLAFIRSQAAIQSGDDEKWQIASNQMALYFRRMNEAVPKDVKERWEKNRLLEAEAAMNEV